MILKVIIIVTGTAWIYYRSWVAVILLIPAGVWYYIQLLDECIKRKEQEFLVQFKELIQTFSSLLNTGYSVENAVKESLKEMQIFYSDDAVILRELEIMVRQIRVQVPVEQAVEELSERTKLPDVESFAGVFVTAKRSGGNLMSIIRNTADQIGDKIDVKREIDTMLAAKKYEFQVMSVIPFGIVLYMTVSFPEFMGNLYGNIAGRGVMTGCLIIYLGAYYSGGGILGGIFGNGQIVQVAKQEVGSSNGEKYWRWYGFDSYVEWCACFVSWCGEQAGLIESGAMPKFSLCENGIDWFKSHGKWQETGGIPSAGSLVFFDWNGDGISDHVGIVEKYEGGIIYTVEGNTGINIGGNNVRGVWKHSYSVGSATILGYGII